MITPLLLAQACADIYTADPAPLFTNVWNFSGTVAGHRKLDGVNVIAFRGSQSATDWIMDASALPVWEPRLGFVHGGFLVGVNDVFIAASLIDGPVVLTGHSLGAARARICAGLFAYYQRPALQCVVFGSPKPAFANLRRILEKSGTLMRSYRNSNDPIPLVPFGAGLYEHTDEWIPLTVHAAPDDLEPLRDHKLALYMQGLTALQSAPS